MPKLTGRLCRLRNRPDILATFHVPPEVTSNARVYERLVSLALCVCLARVRRNRLSDSMTEETTDALKLEYISNRSEKGRIAVEELKATRMEKFKRMTGRKD